MAEHKMNARPMPPNGGRMHRSLGGCTAHDTGCMGNYGMPGESGREERREACGCGEGRGGCSGCGHSPMTPVAPRSAECGLCKEAMERLKMLEFAIVDVAHYLNAYPDSECALAYYHKLLAERDMLRTKMNETCGPLTIYDNTSKDSWDWVKGPWPWNPEAN